MVFRIPHGPIWYIFIPSHFGTLAGIIRCVLRKPYGVYVRGEWPESGLQGWLHNLIYRKATFIIATGQSFVKTLRLTNQQVEEVSPMMRFGKQDLSPRSSYAFGDKIRILYVGYLWPEKGVLEVIQAVSKISLQHTVELQIVGSGNEDQLETVRAEIHNSDCPDNITMLGFVSDKKTLRDLFNSADIFAFPTYYIEGFPRVIYEAMTFGLPVVSTNFPGGRCLLRDSENCKIVKAKDPSALADCLQELIDDEPLRAKLGNAGLEDARELYKTFEDITHGVQVAEHLKKQQLSLTQEDDEFLAS